MDQGPLIRDIPSLKKSLEEIRAVKSVKRVARLARPLLRLFGVDADKVGAALASVEALSSQFEELASLPDRFNDLFASRGWIAYDLLNYEVAKAAIEKAGSGDLDGAEAKLVDYYSAETVEWKLRTMTGVKAFRPRMTLAEKALTDYREGRYYACTLVVLSLLDGMVSELAAQRRGFFAEEADLYAWDSIAGHSKGLNALARIMRTGRRKTRIEEISIPYRNGIMHGMDLGYDNKMVAAKAWAALFAVRDWALKGEAGTLGRQPEKPRVSWKELVGQLRELEEDKARIKQWRPRSITVGKDVPQTGSMDMFAAGSPERRLAEYMHYWRAGNYGHMARCVSGLFLPDARKAPARLREVCATKTLIDFEFTEIADKAPAVTEIETNVLFVEHGDETARSVRFRMLHEDERGEACAQGKPGGSWKVLNWEV